MRVVRQQRAVEEHLRRRASTQDGREVLHLHARRPPSAWSSMSSQRNSRAREIPSPARGSPAGSSTQVSHHCGAKAGDITVTSRFGSRPWLILCTRSPEWPGWSRSPGSPSEKRARGAVAGGRRRPRAAARPGRRVPEGAAGEGRVPDAERRAARARAGDRRPGRAWCSATSAAARRRSRSRIPEATFVLAFRALPIVLVISALSRAALLLARAAGGGARAVAGCCEKPMRRRRRGRASPPRRTSSSAWWRRRSSCGRISPRVSRGELFAIMVGGMASIAGTVLFLYAAHPRPGAARRGGAPPHRLDPFGARGARHRLPHGAARRRRHGRRRSSCARKPRAAWMRSRAARSTARSSSLNIVAMLVVFVALVALVNLVIAPYSLQGALGWALAPLAWLCGVPWSEAQGGGRAARDEDRAQRARRVCRALQADGSLRAQPRPA